MLREKTSLRKLPGSGRALQRSCFRVRLADLVAASVHVDVPAAAPVSNGIDHVIGRIVSFLVHTAGNRVLAHVRLYSPVSFLVLHTAGNPEGRVLAHVRLYSPVSFREMKTAAAAVETELWHHNYTFINHQHFTKHILPAHLIGPLVVVMPHVQRSIAKLGYCLVLQES